MSVFLALATGATLGLASGFHCAAMCGPLAATTCAGANGVDRGSAASYLGARTLGYAAVGALAATMGGPIAGTWGGPVRLVAGLLAALVLVRQGLKLLRSGASAPLVQLRTSAPPRPSRWRAALLGLATSVFPCGALIAAVLSAMALGGARDGALSMATFSLASAPLLLSPALLGATLARRLRTHLGVGALRFAGAVLLLAALAVAGMSTVVALTPQRPACCHHG